MHNEIDGSVNYKRAQGFSLVELIAVLVIVAIVGGVAISRSLPSTSLQLLAARDLLITSVLLAQQKAMSQSAPVVLVTAAHQIQIKLLPSDDSSSAVTQARRVSGMSFPLYLPADIQLNHAQLQFDHLGHTEPTLLTISKGAASVTVSVNEVGYAN